MKQQSRSLARGLPTSRIPCGHGRLSSSCHVHLRASYNGGTLSLLLLKMMTTDTTNPKTLRP